MGSVDPEAQPSQAICETAMRSMPAVSWLAVLGDVGFLFKSGSLIKSESPETHLGFEALIIF